MNLIDEYVEVVDNFLGPLFFPKFDTIIAQRIKDHGIWEESEFNWIKENIKPGYSCVNIGSNVGYFTCLMSKLVGEEGFVWSIEANPKLIPFLEHNVSSLESNNVSILNIAAGDSEGTIDVFINSENCGDNRVYDPSLIKTADYGSIFKETMTVDLKKLDNVVNEKVDFILSDCQGFDYKALLGMDKIIRRDMPSIIFELAPTWIKTLGDNPADMLNYYVGMGYKVSCLQNPNLKSVDDIVASLDYGYSDWHMDIVLEA